MESWKLVWREGFAPQMTEKQLDALREALVTDDVRLIQGATSSPPPLACMADWPCEGACGVSFLGWMGLALKTVGEVEEFFAKACFEADRRLGEPAACRWFLNWFDDTPRAQMRAELLAEVEVALAGTYEPQTAT